MAQGVYRIAKRSVGRVMGWMDVTWHYNIKLVITSTRVMVV
jgi:hypothetical protein